LRALFVVRDLANAEPIGLMQLAAGLKRAGHQAEKREDRVATADVGGIQEHGPEA